MENLISLAIGAPAHLLTLYMIPLFQLDEKKRLIMRVKDCSKEDDDIENIGIKMVKAFATDIKYSFIYGVNFITITI